MCLPNKPCFRPSALVKCAHFLRCGFTCMACGRDLKDAEPRDLTLDHLIPRSKGGGNDPRNIILVCLSCNSRRQAKPWREAYPGGSHARIKRVIRRKLNLKLARAILDGTTGHHGVENQDLPEDNHAESVDMRESRLA